ncbi:MAG: arginine--tRNA ligase [Candidatus Woykebacteria bacterium RIFCSPHIGHO2_12_FULL_43_10]|uniref:Arginine--tRNA ligase n=2 Tax=Candidatus Woykeibacteriota TaxID=1817899 RepID=A0A1G1WY58_9BACT|nr:MAG: arginine--tRNA ligase [Candidatus Woykebacteria bacterium RIFCSPHIGHO2_01_FULL_43_29]OGY29824.1 MAG: arginine--tRNA ligase [Candidatus Woykebacteria bacterium RIFCSPHIGHO2_02_FULL_43_16b]OGY30492.1 MAG: arginine--tRNA ligase [Candidatus Woykebacteria bacterium RIFCSPHIGHO2_12_FULL_43_10]OGY32653.1 MAG: arginine--tRNA ligase [Candidatus Woykebacteria bacterium RIFCSPLOWO2_01_FULL_43_14]
MKKQLREQLKKTIEHLGFDTSLVSVENQTHPALGDYTSNVALILAAMKKQSPNEIATSLKNSFPRNPSLKKIEVKNGFINFYLTEEFYYDQLKRINLAGFDYENFGLGKQARVEYVSANPTGPLHIGNARGGPIGETICRVLEKVGYKVLREYVCNDTGGQVTKLGESVLYYFEPKLGSKQEFPKDGYQGDYVQELAQKARQELSKSETSDKEKLVENLANFSVHELHKQTLETCAQLGIHFDYIQSENDLISSDRTKKVLDYLKEKGFVRDQDGAVWFAPKDEFLKDRECVLIKSDGRTTYFANDIAYHKLKFETDPSIVIDIFGSNHHGHVPRLQASVSALGYDVSKFKVILYQYVRVLKGKEFVKMSKRAGNFVTAQEVLDEVGRDAFNFFMLLNSVNTHMDFDLDLAKKQSSNNPVYYIQYAHARCANILSKSQSLDRKEETAIDYASLLKEAEEIALMKKIVMVKDMIVSVSNSFEIQAIPQYTMSLADLFHKFYEKHQVIDAPSELREARLGLVRVTMKTLAELLQVLNVSAPDRM